jgi:hypothetical protein
VSAEPGRGSSSRVPDDIAAAERPNVVFSVTDAIRRRRDAAARMVPLPCGCRDPLPCDLRRWCPVWDGPRPVSRRGLAVALDELDELGLCACWTAPRPHPQAVA